MDWILALQDKYSIGVENTNWKKKDMIWEKKKNKDTCPISILVWELQFDP
jgi:hypothetical protein